MGANVMDFTDLGLGVGFTYKGQKYEIPSFTKSQMTDLMDISNKMVAISKSLSKEDKEKLEKGDIDSDNLKNLFEVQQQFVICGTKKVMENGSYQDLTLEEIEPWPWRLTNKINSLIQDMMSTVSGASDKEEGKKNPTEPKLKSM